MAFSTETLSLSPMKNGENRKRYALVGAGSRSAMYSEALTGTYSGTALLAAFCDTNSHRMAFWNGELQSRFGANPVPAYSEGDFSRMLKQERIDTVIVTTIDRFHHDYIIRALEAGCGVITEKPMTIDVEKCRAILDAVKRTGRSVRVTFNYRYAPSRTKIKELLQAGTIGEVKSVHFEWLLDTVHGADYFRRWHRDKANSGGLMVHKATHHFDLVNWWLDSSPQTVFGLGNLAFYGKANAEARGEKHPYLRGTSPAAKGDPFALDLASDPNLKALYLDAEKEDGYQRDQNVFGDGISIEDTMNLVVRYRSGAQLSYSLTAYARGRAFASPLPEPRAASNSMSWRNRTSARAAARSAPRRPTARGSPSFPSGSSPTKWRFPRRKAVTAAAIRCCWPIFSDHRSLIPLAGRRATSMAPARS